MELKVMSFNMLYGGYEGGVNELSNRKSRILEVIRREQPDIIGCQEVLHTTQRWLEKELVDEYAVVGCGRGENCKGEGVPILYRKKRLAMLKFDTVWLSETPNEPGSRLMDVGQSPCPRLAHQIQLRCVESKTPVRVLNTHLDCGNTEARRRELEILKGYVGKVSSDELFIMTGDFNLRPEEDVLRDFLSDMKQMGVADVTQNVTASFHLFGQCVPAVKIDYILSNGVASDAKIADDPHADGIWYSDHYALCARLSR